MSLPFRWKSGALAGLVVVTPKPQMVVVVVVVAAIHWGLLPSRRETFSTFLSEQVVRECRGLPATPVAKPILVLPVPCKRMVAEVVGFRDPARVALSALAVPSALEPFGIPVATVA
jgi:hypothetical protein